MKKLILLLAALFSTVSLADHVVFTPGTTPSYHKYAPFVPNPSDDPYVGEWGRKRLTEYYILDENMDYKKIDTTKPYLEPADFLKYHNRRVVLDKNPLNIPGGDISVDFLPIENHQNIQGQFFIKRHDIVILTKRRFDNLVAELVYYKSLLDDK